MPRYIGPHGLTRVVLDGSDEQPRLDAHARWRRADEPAPEPAPRRPRAARPPAPQTMIGDGQPDAIIPLAGAPVESPDES